MKQATHPHVLAACLLSFATATAQIQIDSDRELFVTDPAVVDDARATGSGPWSFGTLMSRMAGNVPPSRFVEAWLGTWLTPQTVNGLTLFEQPKADVIQTFLDNWHQVSPGNDLDLDQAPFRLLAIVNRADLIETTPTITQAAELRFVYGAFNPVSSSNQTFFVIFEYGVPATTCQDIVDWQTQWHALAQHPLGSAAYNAALQAITDQITQPSPQSGQPNGSLLNQLRSNDLIAPSPFWDMREWHVLPTASGDPNLSVLQNVPVVQTPRRSTLTNSAGRQKLMRWLDQNRAAILAGDHVVPTLFEGAPFLAQNAINDQGHALPPGFNPNVGGTLWWAPGSYNGQNMTVEDAQVRHNFAVNTCSGCHFHETGTPFVMVTNRQPGSASSLSPFLTGITVDDPISPMALDGTGQLVPVQHTHNDLRRRAFVMQRILTLQCGTAAATTTLAEIEAETASRPH
ncbi:MAG: hypothetical protein KAI24_24225 [Planctomycetes bacterium]|nr:hypothetical protein [Planctomycetota bacterium]